MATQKIEGVAATCKVLRLLIHHFANGLPPGQIAKNLNMDASRITRYVATLEDEGFIERVPETGCIRPSHWFARSSVEMLRSLDKAIGRLEESKKRLGDLNGSSSLE